MIHSILFYFTICIFCIWPIFMFSIKHYNAVCQNHDNLTLFDWFFAFMIAISPFANIYTLWFFWNRFDLNDFTVNYKENV